jgi:hypothetical protein
MMRYYITIALAPLYLLLLSGCEEGGDTTNRSSTFPPEEYGYELVEVIGAPEPSHKTIIMQGVPPGGQLELDHNGHLFQGDANKHYLIHGYENSLGDISGYIVYTREDGNQSDKIAPSQN